MSQRSPVDRQRIAGFLNQLGRQCRCAGRLYLVGGSSVVFENLRKLTLDIDLTFEVDPGSENRLVQAIRELKEELDVNVEQVSPGDFIPLPAGYRDRSEFVGRFGELDVFHFDLYSTALSKIERGSEQDFADVQMLLNANKIEWARLQGFFDEILPRMGEHSLRQDPVEFEQNFRALAAMRRDLPGSHGGGI